MDLSLGFLFCSIDPYFCLCASTVLSWWLWLCSTAWSQVSWFLQFHSSFSRLLWLFEFFLYFHTNCEIICSSSVKNTVGSLIGIALIALGSILIFTMLILPIHEHSICLHLFVSHRWFLSPVFYNFLYIGLGEGNGTPLQYSCLENPMDREAWWAAVHGIKQSQTRLSNFTSTFHFYALEKEMATHSSVLA